MLSVAERKQAAHSRDIRGKSKLMCTMARSATCSLHQSSYVLNLKYTHCASRNSPLAHLCRNWYLLSRHTHVPSKPCSLSDDHTMCAIPPDSCAVLLDSSVSREDPPPTFGGLVSHNIATDASVAGSFRVRM